MALSSGGRGWGERGSGRGGDECESDPMSAPVEIYWLSPPVGLRLNAFNLI
jgi:hypothetical protein